MTELEQQRRIRIANVGFAYEDQPKVEVRNCNLCGEQQWVVLTHKDRYGFSTRANACCRCGLVFLSPVMTAEAYRQFYAEVYRPLVSAYHGRRIDAETIQEEQRLYAAELAEFLAPFTKKWHAGTLLDIGGSTGVVAHYLAQRLGVRATVLDPAPFEVEQARQLGLETIVGLLEDFDHGDRRFNLITMCQTVDHLLDVAGAIQKIRQMLAPSGLFFVDIVDFRAAYLRNWSVEEAIKVDHPFYLIEPTIEAYLTRAGLEVLRVSYAADRLHIGYVCQPTVPQPDYLPPADTVDYLLREVRKVQNWPEELRGWN